MRTKKLRRVVKHAHYVSGGAFQGIHFSKENISGKNGRNLKKTADIVQKNFLTSVKTADDVSYRTFVWKIKSLVENIVIFQLFADFELKMNGTSARNFQHGCQICILSVRFKCPF